MSASTSANAAPAAAAAAASIHQRRLAVQGTRDCIICCTLYELLFLRKDCNYSPTQSSNSIPPHCIQNGRRRQDRVCLPSSPQPFNPQVIIHLTDHSAVSPSMSGPRPVDGMHSPQTGDTTPSSWVPSSSALPQWPFPSPQTANTGTRCPSPVDSSPQDSMSHSSQPQSFRLRLCYCPLSNNRFSWSREIRQHEAARVNANREG